MKKKDLIVGKIYKQQNYIFKYCNHKNNTVTKNIGYGDYLDIKNQCFYKESTAFNSDLHPILLATPSEIKHLDAYIKASKYVEPIKKIEYEIY